MIRELRGEAELRAACGDDDLVMWTAQGLTGGARAWALGEAVVAGCRGVSRADRLAVWGDASCAVELVRHALAELGPSFRPWGEAALMSEVTAKLDDVREGGRFSWMSLPAGAVGGAVEGVAWLEGADAEVGALLAQDAPASYAVPGLPGVRRWAGMREDGVLAAVAADAWSAPSVGLLAGVATRAAFRGRGLAERVCRWVSAQLVAAHGRAALMVDDDNAAALRVYERIGYRRLPVMAAHVNWAS
ncbi:GNAT family N-acetyltransferase [Nonomuraea aridisoli]|uniref:GNAT family N-acetyltransferase n=1 Tax=Nonomuraea aridisoli TaxID=2070368 RepID=A0A2W2DYV8_9ACTN|nr:GNAT family N-acetyltransferase [Nonomuraea aridisoli]PZG17116.1 GNAT family N-acetyltransferase [Nonomuraea aridisoli]